MIQSINDAVGRHPARATVCLVIALAALLILRHPDGIIDANFWAEDWWAWYPEAYALGPASLVVPHTGYLQSFSRLMALVVQPLPLLWAPTLFAVAALAVQLMPVMLLVSRRLDPVWPNLPSRVFFAVVMTCLPNSFETFGNVTNSQWYLALAAFLVTMLAPPRTVGERSADLAILVVSGLSGPFCLFLLPVAAWQWLRVRGRINLVRLVVIGMATSVQAGFLITTMADDRPVAVLGAGAVNLARIIALQVEIGLLLGSHVVSQVSQSALWQPASTATAVALAGIAVLAVAVWRGGRLFRMFTVFAGLTFVAALTHPVLGPSDPAWLVLTRPGAGQRYFLFAMLTLAAALLSLATDRQRLVRGVGLAGCAVLIVGMAGDFPYPKMRPTNFNAQARLFQTAPAGTALSFELQPPGASPMQLIKR